MNSVFGGFTDVLSDRVATGLTAGVLGESTVPTPSGPDGVLITATSDFLVTSTGDNIAYV